MQKNYRLDSMQVARYCRINNLCTGATIEQYNRILHYVDNHPEAPLRDVCVMISICSTTNKSIDDIENDFIKYMLSGEF